MKREYTYILSYFKPDGSKESKTYDSFPDEAMDDLDAKDIYWSLTVTRKDSKEPNQIWKGLYY